MTPEEARHVLTGGVINRSRLSLENDGPVPSLTVPVRLWAFATRETVKRKGRKLQTITDRIAWQGWNPDPVMADHMARLPGSGSFYWSGAIRAFVAGRQMLRDDPTVDQIKIETISGREIGRLYRR